MIKDIVKGTIISITLVCLGVMFVNADYNLLELYKNAAISDRIITLISFLSIFLFSMSNKSK